MINFNKKPFPAGDRSQKGTAPRARPTPVVILPIVLTLSVQVLISMSAVAIPVFMPVAAGELNVPSSYVGIFMSLIYLSATVFAPVSGYFIDRFGPICVSQICLILCALGLGAISIPVTDR
jgi:MFS family permease